MKDESVIPDYVRRLACSIVHAVMKRNPKPALDRNNMVIDDRMVTVSPAIKSKKFPLWARLSTLEKGQPVNLPLETYRHFDERDGTRTTTVQINQRKEGSFGVGILTDVTDALAASRAAYQARCEALALDLGLNTLFATD